VAEGVEPGPIVAVPDRFYLFGPLVRRSPSKTAVNALKPARSFTEADQQAAAAAGDRKGEEKRSVSILCRR
jgi:hypothetical protein